MRITSFSGSRKTWHTKMKRNTLTAEINQLPKFSFSFARLLRKKNKQKKKTIICFTNQWVNSLQGIFYLGHFAVYFFILLFQTFYFFLSEFFSSCLSASICPLFFSFSFVSCNAALYTLCAEPQQSRRGWVNTMLDGCPLAESTASFSN